MQPLSVFNWVLSLSTALSYNSFHSSTENAVATRLTSSAGSFATLLRLWEEIKIKGTGRWAKEGKWGFIHQHFKNNKVTLS